MATIKTSIRVDESIMQELKRIIEKTNLTLAEIINATLYDFIHQNINRQYDITSNYKWLKRFDDKLLKEIKE